MGGDHFDSPGGSPSHSPLRPAKNVLHPHLCCCRRDLSFVTCREFDQRRLTLSPANTKGPFQHNREGGVTILIAPGVSLTQLPAPGKKCSSPTSLLLSS